jgi:kynureninase
MTRDDALALDAADPLAPLRAQFLIPEGLIYLDGNSLGLLPRGTATRVRQVVEQEWGEGLITSWNRAGWIDLPQRVGDKIARLVGAAPGELVVADSTSVNLYKVLAAALRIAQADAAARGGADMAAGHAPPVRRRILSERSNFPTDLYIAQSLASQHGFELVLAEADELPALLADPAAPCAVLMLTHVNYRSGQMHEMAALNRAAHAAGALAIWDLAHSAGAVPVDLHGSGDAAAAADFAVGCGYKYLNGGPGAPAFVWVHPRHAERFEQPLSGWLGHAAPFAFSADYRPAPGIGRYLCGTPPVLSLAALECGVDTVLAADAIAGPGRGMAALREKSLALTRLFAQRAQALCPELRLVSPREDACRGSQVCLAWRDEALPAGSLPGTAKGANANQDADRTPAGYAVMQALIARGVIGDFRAGDRSAPAGSAAALDILRFGFTPLTVRHVDAFDAAAHLHAVLATGEWQEPRHQQRAAVT